jgi:hypothetical protein
MHVKLRMNLRRPRRKPKYSLATDSEQVPRGKGEKNRCERSEIVPEMMCLQGVKAQHFLIQCRHVLRICPDESENRGVILRLHRQRFGEHQKMPKHAGWKLVYYEAYLNEQDARDRERMLKQYGAARGHLKQRIACSTGLESAG